MARFDTLLFGGGESRSPPTPLPEFARDALLISFREKLIATKQNPVQMLLEPKGMEPLAVSLSVVHPGTAAVATWFRRITVSASKVVGGSLDAISLLLRGGPEDEQAIRAAEAWRDESGNPLPFDPAWYSQVRVAAKPLLVNFCAAPEAACDPAFLAASELLAKAFFEMCER